MKLPPYTILVRRLKPGMRCLDCPGVSPHDLRFVVAWYTPEETFCASRLTCERLLVSVLDSPHPANPPTDEDPR